MLTDHQIAQRARTVGASEIFDVLIRPARVWRRKVLGEDDVDPDADFIRLGNAFERPLIERYAAGRLIMLSGDNGEPCSWIDPERPWCSMTPDAVIGHKAPPDWAAYTGPVWFDSPRHGWRNAHLLEIKTSSIWAPTDDSQQWSDGRDWTPETPAGERTIPDRYRAQVVWMLGITRMAYGVVRRLHFRSEDARRLLSALPDDVLQAQAGMWLDVLLRSDLAEIHTYRVDADQPLFLAMASKARVFVDRYILGGEVPDPDDDHPDDSWAIQRHLHPRAGDLIIDADEAGCVAIEAHIEAHRQAKRWKDELELCQLATARLIGDHGGIRDGATVIRYGNNGGRGRRWTMPKGVKNEGD